MERFAPILELSPRPSPVPAGSGPPVELSGLPKLRIIGIWRKFDGPGSLPAFLPAFRRRLPVVRRWSAGPGPVVPWSRRAAAADGPGRVFPGGLPRVIWSRNAGRGAALPSSPAGFPGVFLPSLPCMVPACCLPSLDPSLDPSLGPSILLSVPSSSLLSFLPSFLPS